MFLRPYHAYVRNWRILRAAVNAVGQECESWSYEELDRDAEDRPVLERTIDGHPLRFFLERWETQANGDLLISIDASGLPTLAGVKPSYQFAKRPDGSVYYP